MPISSREFFTTKPRIVEYMTLTLYHPAFGYLRYVANQFQDKVIAGNTYQAAAMEIVESLQDERNSISYQINLGRVGSQAKLFAKAIDKYPLGWVIGIDATVGYWLSDDLTTPYRPLVNLSVGTFSMDGDSVAITLDTANPRGQGVARRYNGDDFPGTKAKV